MSSKPKNIKIPGPDHPITIERNRNRVVVKVAGRVVAHTRDALTLREASYGHCHINAFYCAILTRRREL